MAKEKQKIRFVRIRGRIVPIKVKKRFSDVQKAAAFGAGSGVLIGTSSTLSAPSLKFMTKKFDAKIVPSLFKKLLRISKVTKVLGISLGLGGTAFTIKKTIEAKEGSKAKTFAKLFGSQLLGSFVGQGIGAAGSGVGVSLAEAARKRRLKKFTLLKF